MQSSLFDTIDEQVKAQKKPETFSLIIQKPAKQLLSKKQQEFNRLVKKLENLRNGLEEATTNLDKNLQFYAANVHPLEERVRELEANKVKLLYRFYDNGKFFKQKEYDLLAELIVTLLEDYMDSIEHEPDAELQAIYTALHEISYDEAKQNAINGMKDEMKDMFGNMGFDMDMDDFDENMTDEQLYEKMHEVEEKMKQFEEKNEEYKAKRPKGKRDQAAEVRKKLIEEARKKNISTIYKQLAKAFHPDLEPDEFLKLQKEELMKKLTVAYENNDLHTLLMLEMEWMKREDANTEKLTDDKLGIYNEVLKGQVRELEIEFKRLEFHPRYMCLKKYFSRIIGVGEGHIRKCVESVKNKVDILEYDERSLSKNDPGFVKKMINEYKRNKANESMYGEYSAADLKELMAMFGVR